MADAHNLVLVHHIAAEVGRVEGAVGVHGNAKIRVMTVGPTSGTIAHAAACAADLTRNKQRRERPGYMVDINIAG